MAGKIKIKNNPSCMGIGIDTQASLGVSWHPVKVQNYLLSGTDSVAQWLEKIFLSLWYFSL